MSEPSISTPYSRGFGDPVPRYCCNPRRAYDRDDRQIAPMNPAIAMQNGVRVICSPPCRHEGELPTTRFPITMAMGNGGPRLRRSVHGRKGRETEQVGPRWSDVA